MSTDHLTHDKEVKTIFDCTECHKQIVALVDYSLNGNHVIECPHCGHEHCRVVKDGKITGDRWSSRAGSTPIKPRRVWKHNAAPMQTTTASEFIRARWMDKYTI